jgi:hypothetical protein
MTETTRHSAHSRHCRHWRSYGRWRKIYDALAVWPRTSHPLRRTFTNQQTIAGTSHVFLARRRISYRLKERKKNTCKLSSVNARIKFHSLSPRYIDYILLHAARASTKCLSLPSRRDKSPWVGHGPRWMCMAAAIHRDRSTMWSFVGVEERHLGEKMKENTIFRIFCCHYLVI